MGGGGPLFLFEGGKIVIMKWLPIPLLLFEGDNSNSINNKKNKK